MTVQAPRVSLVSMPWPGLAEPSLGLATLKAHLSRYDISCRIHHSYIRLLRHLTQQTYDTFARIVGVNEFLFTAVLDEPDSLQLDRLLDVCADPEGTRPHPAYPSPLELAEIAIQIRNEVIPQYLEECADDVLEAEPTLVGFTCMFDQTVASLALAEVLRRRRPDLMIVAGGYALFGEPGVEIVSSFPQLDGVVQGDGEPAIRALALASVGVGSLDEVPNLITRTRQRVRHTALADLSAAPTPDFDDWFADIAALDRRDQVRITPRSLPLEGSRGCWWGQTSHCTFCGIDETSLSYRSRPADQVLGSLRELRSRYGDLEFRFSDYILARSHYEELLPVLAEEEPLFRLSCEIKANQSVTRMNLLAKAGFVELQPGIESFSTQMLRAMDKGVRGIQNVATLKQGFLNHVVIHYNLLFGFPEEQLDWYKDMLARIPTIYHLMPPISRTLVQITRFAPLQVDPQRFAIGRRAQHDWRYDVMFSKSFLEDSHLDLDRYVYCFERTFDVAPELAEAHRLIVHQIEHWKDLHRGREVYLCYETHADGATFTDTRFGPARTIEVDHDTWAVYREFDQNPRSLASVTARLVQSGLSEPTVGDALRVLTDARLLWQEDRYALGLALPADVALSPDQHTWKREWLCLRS